MVSSLIRKTSCVIFGKNPFSVSPVWKLDDTVLKIETSMKYLGTSLGDLSGSIHTETRIISVKQIHL